MKSMIRVCSLMIAIGPLAAAAQEARKLPSGKEVIDRFVEVTGGKEKYEAVKSMTAKGKFNIQEAGAGGPIELRFAAPDKARLNIEIEGFGTVQKGSLGKVVWEVSPLAGTRLIEGDEGRRFLEGLQMSTIFDPSSIYESIENVGVEEVDGEPCYKLAMKRKESDDLDYTFYSVESGLAMKSITQEPTPAGKITASTTLSNYNEVDGLKTAMKMVQELAGVGMTQEIEFESVKYNEPIEDSVFALPDAVKKLAEEAEKAKSEE